MKLKNWPNNYGRARQHARYARQVVDRVLGKAAFNVHAPNVKMSVVLLALHEYALNHVDDDAQSQAATLALQAIGVYEELTGEWLQEGT